MQLLDSFIFLRKLLSFEKPFSKQIQITVVAKTNIDILYIYNKMLPRNPHTSVNNSQASNESPGNLQQISDEIFTHTTQ